MTQGGSGGDGGESPGGAAHGGREAGGRAGTGEGNQGGDPPGDDPARRVLTRGEAVRRHGPGRDHRLVFTNGCFDLLHRGHAALLSRAAALGDRLVVGLNSDASVRRLKGPGRPLQPKEDRAYLLAALRAVDAVTVFEEDTPLALVEALVPDVLVKGGDYGPEEVVGREVVRRGGGEVRILPLERGRSTSDVLRRAREVPADDGSVGGGGGT